MYMHKFKKNRIVKNGYKTENNTSTQGEKQM